MLPLDVLASLCPEIELLAEECKGLTCRVLMHGKPHQLDAANKMILRNMADLMTREVWGAYEHDHKQRVLQLTKVNNQASCN